VIIFTVKPYGKTSANTVITIGIAYDYREEVDECHINLDICPNLSALLKQTSEVIRGFSASVR